MAKKMRHARKSSAVLVVGNYKENEQQRTALQLREQNR